MTERHELSVPCRTARDRWRWVQTHALLVGALDLSVGAMCDVRCCVASFLIGSIRLSPMFMLGRRRILLSGCRARSINGGLVFGFKIPSIIATLATLSILSGISLTLRETPGGPIDRDFTSCSRRDRADPHRVSSAS